MVSKWRFNCTRMYYNFKCLHRGIFPFESFRWDVLGIGGGFWVNLKRAELCPPTEVYVSYKHSFLHLLTVLQTNTQVWFLSNQINTYNNMESLQKQFDPKRFYYLLNVSFCVPYICYNVTQGILLFDNFRFVVINIVGGGEICKDLTKLISLSILGRFPQISY